MSTAALCTVVSGIVNDANDYANDPAFPRLALSEETQLICKDYDAAALRLQVAATQPEQLCGLA